MKKTALVCIGFSVAMLILISVSFNIKTVEAADSANYYIDYVAHEIEVMRNGYILINDTIRIVGNASAGTTLDSFRIGFPYKYGAHVLRCVVYNGSDVIGDVKLDVPLDNRMGFYAAEIDFLQSLDISSGVENVFSVGFILSNDLLNASSSTRYILDFPAYPSLTKSAVSCNVSMSFPDSLANITITKDDGAVNVSAYEIAPLPEFTAMSAIADFTLTSDKLRIFSVNDLTREVTINEAGEINGADSYYITSKEPQTIAAIEIILPANASVISAHDQFGRKFAQTPTFVGREGINLYRIAFPLPLESYKSTRFTIKYSLPNWYISALESSNGFNVTLPLFMQMDYYIKSASVKVTLPEGARILNLEGIIATNAYSLTRNIFQESITINRQGVGCLEDLYPEQNILQIAYEYNPLWLSFRPTLWVLTLSVIGCAIAVVWKRPKAPVIAAVPAIAVKLRSEDIKAFIDAYEDKRKTILEMDNLEVLVKKGKIPRRRYKVRRKTLEMHLDALSRSSAEIKEKMRAAGGKFADLMRQLEIAETEINEVEANIKSIEARHSRGELSLEAYRKLLADYQRRKEAANTTISGILLRLREELR